jgi:uncharacterized Tic20 family protein
MNYDDLKKLDELRKNGAISEEEYQREKEKFFNQPDNSSFAKPLWGLEENSYIALMHISQLAGYILPGLGFIAPVVLWMMNKDNNAKVDSAGKDILNFMLSLLIYGAASVVLALILIGFPLLIALGVMQVVFAIMAAIKANNGETLRYPLSINFLR